MPKKYRKLQNTVLKSFTLLAVVLIIIIGFVVGDRYINGAMGNYQTTAYAYTKSTADLIDGDTIAAYLESGEKDEYYYEILEILNTYRNNTDIREFFVFVPMENEMIYLWDAVAEGEPYDLGARSAYLDSSRDFAFSVYKQDPPETLMMFRDETYGNIATAYSPVFDSNGEPVAIVGVGIYLFDLQENMGQFLGIVLLTILIVISMAIVLCYNFVKKKIVRPINKIRDVSTGMVENLENEGSIEVTIHTRDEIEELFEAFKQMYSDVREYISKLSAVTAEKERIGAELDVAKHIQASMLPCIFPAFPERKEIDIYATMEPAKEVGGDFYDFFMVDERHLAIVIADVSGKGVPAALFMVIGKTLIKDHTTPGRDLGQVFTEVNDLLCESNSEELFITAFEGVLDLQTGEFVYVNAGHEQPFICKAGGDFEVQKIRAGFVLAGMNGIKYRAGSMTLEPGDKLFQYTDGVTEATNVKNELYGMERLGDVLNRVKNSAPSEILPAVKKDIDEFVGEAPQFDDITMLCLEYKARTEDAQ